MAASVSSKSVQVPAIIRESDGATLIWTTAGYRTPEEAGVAIDNSAGGGGVSTEYEYLPARSITGTTAVNASLIGTIDNPGRKYRTAVVRVRNLTSIPFTDLVLRTKDAATNPSYDQDVAGSQWSAPSLYVLATTMDPTTLVDGEVKITLDIRLVASFEIRACAAGTTASLSYSLTTEG